MPASTSKKPPTRRAKRTTLAKALSNKTSRLAPTTAIAGYAINDPILHPQFGDGVVTAIDGEKLTIKFADGRVKQILDYYVKRRPR